MSLVHQESQARRIIGTPSHQLRRVHPRKWKNGADRRRYLAPGASSVKFLTSLQSRSEPNRAHQAGTAYAFAQPLLRYRVLKICLTAEPRETDILPRLSAIVQSAMYKTGARSTVTYFTQQQLGSATGSNWRQFETLIGSA